MRLIYFSLCCFLLLTGSALFAQDKTEKLYSVEFNQTTIAQVVSDLEAKGNVHFYYDPVVMDSLRVTLKADGQPLSYILDRMFANTKFNFVVNNNNVFLTKNTRLELALAPGYYPDKVSMPKDAANKTAEADIRSNAEIVSQKSVSSVKLYEIGLKTNELKPGNATIAGYLTALKTGEPIDNAVISVQNSSITATTNQLGFYALTLPRGAHTLLINSPGNTATSRKIMLYADGKLNIELQEKMLSVKEVNIVSDKLSNVSSLQMGVTKIDIKTIKQVPAVFGEPDILRVVLTLPGVQSVGEASTGFNVRGGSADQNLILLDDATIYNPSHFFGFFSAFNPDIVKDVQLYKNTIPEKFGGRLSSVLEVNNREGNKNKFEGSAGIGIITSRFNIEGPIDSGRTSFIAGGRATYSNWLLKLLPDAYKNSRASFYDFNLGISHKINAKNDLYLAGYYSKDNFRLNSDTGYNYSNKNASVKWRHAFNDKFAGTFTVAGDMYEYSISSDVNPINAYHLNFNINQVNFKSDFTYSLSKQHLLNFGLSSVYYKLRPGDYNPIGSQSLVIQDIVPQEQALETAIYLGDQYDITENFTINAGLRYTLYNYLGPQSVNSYAPGLPVIEENITNVTTYGKNKVIQTYHGPEIRLSARYNLAKDLSVKAAYNTLRQYIHLLSNTTAIAPTDIWKLSDPNIKPQFGSQVSLGLYKNFNPQAIETSVEVYYKKLKDYLDYKSGATLVLNHHIETDVISTKGKAYGIEFLIKKNSGKLNGWMSYAYSRTLLKMDDENNGAPINGGNYYPANYDKPHAFNFTGNFHFKQRYHVSLNLTYSTGRPITLPVAKYVYGGSERVFYSERNAYRIPDYFRSDVSFNIEGNHRVNQRFHNSFTLGFYNVTGAKNAYSTYFTEEGGVIKGYKLSIFASVIPFLNYNVKF